MVESAGLGLLCPDWSGVDCWSTEAVVADVPVTVVGAVVGVGAVVVSTTVGADD